MKDKDIFQDVNKSFEEYEKKIEKLRKIVKKIKKENTCQGFTKLKFLS